MVEATTVGRVNEPEERVGSVRHGPAATANACAAAAAAEHEARLAAAREAAEQVAAWQAQLVGTVESLMETPCADHWRPYLAWALGLTPGEARELVELVDRLGELPRTRDALESGERSMRSVLSIARRATPDTEAMILESTEAFTGAQLQRALGAWDRVTAPSERAGDESETDENHVDPQRSSASWGWRDGRFRLRADLDAADGAALAAVLEAERNKVDAAEGESSIVSGDERTCAEALLALGERAASSRSTRAGFAPESITTHLVIHAREKPDGQVEVDRSFIPGAGPVPAWAADMLAEHGPVVTTVMINGEPAAHTSLTRFATPEQRRLLLARDQGCAYPGCGATTRLTAHHIRHFKDGGPTELSNLVLLCRRHHRIVHRCDISIVPDPDVPPEVFRWRFSHQDGTPMKPRAPARAPGLQHLMRTRRRRTGDGDPLTHWGLGVIIEHWLEQRDAVTAA